MRYSSNFLVVLALATAVEGCAGATLPRAQATPPTFPTGEPAPSPPPPPPTASQQPTPPPNTPDPIRSVNRLAHPGFDTRRYPGDAALRAWHLSSPYEWVGYYLVAPCQTGPSWVGKRSAIKDAGFGIAVVFVGEQDWTGPPSDSGAAAKSGGTQCTVANLTTAKGALDAARADSTAAAEGFPNGTVIYLDVERVESVSQRMTAYIRAWVHAMLVSGRYTPGIYVHEKNATAVQAIVASEYASSGRGNVTPPFWVAARSDAFNLDSSTPTASNYAFATVWQGLFNVAQTWGGVTLTIDANVATSANPSGGG